MPGAFTTTCSTEHLPGFVKNAKKIQSLGVDTIAVVTTNDRFVNQEWGTQQGLVTSAQDDSGKASIAMLCDADGDFVKSIGLADDMGFGVGIRSKRFAMITDNGVVQTLLTDEGMDDCSATSAANVIKVLSPESVTSDSAIEIDGKVILGVAGGIVALLAVLISGGGGGSAPSPAPKPIKATPNVVVPQKVRPSSDSNFSLLNEYMKQ
jgi:glutaredoxin/glutathione-dependent peroxiredoxin